MSSGWGTGGTQERQADCCTEEEDSYHRTLAADRTIMVRRTSKRVKEVVDKMLLPEVVRLRRSFWDQYINDTEKQSARRCSSFKWLCVVGIE